MDIIGIVGNRKPYSHTGNKKETKNRNQQAWASLNF